MSLLFCCALLPLAGGADDSPGGRPERFALTPKAYRTWRIDLPGERIRVPIGTAFLPKPFSLKQLATVVKEVLEAG